MGHWRRRAVSWCGPRDGCPIRSRRIRRADEHDLNWIHTWRLSTAMGTFKVIGVGSGASGPSACERPTCFDVRLGDAAEQLALPIPHRFARTREPALCRRSGGIFIRFTARLAGSPAGHAPARLKSLTTRRTDKRGMPPYRSFYFDVRQAHAAFRASRRRRTCIPPYPMFVRRFERGDSALRFATASASSLDLRVVGPADGKKMMRGAGHRCDSPPATGAEHRLYQAPQFNVARSSTACSRSRTSTAVAASGLASRFVTPRSDVVVARGTRSSWTPFPLTGYSDVC